MSETPTPAAIEIPAVPEKKHHAFGPSKLNYIKECAAFTSRKGEVNEAAEQGTFLHELMELMLGQVKAEAYSLTMPQIDGWVTANNELTEEEREYLKFTCARCDAFLAKKPGDFLVEVNVEVKDPEGNQINHGTLDVVFFFGAEWAILIDFKFGKNPVPEARVNMQGKNYAVGLFQLFPALQNIGIEFVMPKLTWTTSAVFTRTQINEAYQEIAAIITKAKLVLEKPEESQQYMKVGLYCDWCELRGSCAKLANARQVAAISMTGLPAPLAFSGALLKTPQDVALARYWVDIIEKGVEEVKTRAFELAAASETGSISCELPDGRIITYEIAERNSARSLGSAIEVSEALKEVITPQEVLGAADLSIVKLETVVSKAMQEVAQAKGEKLTKKKAVEIMNSTLMAMGLMTQPDTKIRFLRLSKPTTQTKQIEESK